MIVNVTNQIVEYDGFDYVALNSDGWGVVCNISFDFEYDQNTTIEELIDKTCQITGASARESIDSDEKTGYKIIVNERLLIAFEDTNLLLDEIIKNYNLGNTINSLIEITCGRGEVLRCVNRDKGFRFYIPSREGKKHHNPHIHVEHRNGNSGSVDLITGEQYKNGSLTQKQMRYVRNIIDNNKKMLLEYWNNHTDGIKVDLNVALGISQMSN